MNRILFFVWTVLFLSFHCMVPSSYGMEGKITELTINKNQVEATIQAENCFNYDLEEIVFNGIPIKLLFDIKLFCDSRYWFDQEIASIKINHVIKYDNLKDIFIIHHSDKDDSTIKVDDLVEAELSVCNINNLQMVTQNDLDPNKHYYITYSVETAAHTENSHLPLYLDYLLRIFPWWGQKTEQQPLPASEAPDDSSSPVE